MTAQELAGKNNIVAILASKKVFDIFQQREVELPSKQLFIKRIYTLRDYRTNRITCDILFFQDGKEERIMVPGEIKVKLAGPRIEKKIKQEFKEYQFKTLEHHLSYKGEIGSDPEIFVTNGEGALIPAFKFLGSKQKPDKGPSVPNGCNDIYWDGFQAEFTTIADPCMGWVSDSIQNGLKGIYLKAKEFDKSAKLSIKTVFDIPVEVIRTTDPQYTEFGCMPTLNIYGLEDTRPSGRDVYIRPAGGHIHFGYSHIREKNKDLVVPIVKALDAILGVACVSLFARFDDPRRRHLYGKAGEYRLPKHGLEYRVLSNAWLSHPLIANIVFDVARQVFAFGQMDFLDKWNATEEETITTINTCDVDKAREILKRNEETFKKIIHSRYHNSEKVEFVYNIFMNGMESVIQDPADIVKNWCLDDTWTTHCDGEGKTVNKAYNKKEKV